MSSGFWDNLPRPFFALAPMADVTDAAFRFIIAKYGKPDVTWTEFVSADGLCSAGRKHLLVNLDYSETERPVVAQIFGANPERVHEASKLIASLGFDGIDLNMGCPERSICAHGSGAAMLKNVSLACETIQAAKAGGHGLPVSVKTRTGYFRDELEKFVPQFLEQGIAALTIHARTRKDMSKVPARWEQIALAVEMARGTKTLIIGNGDVAGLDDARRKAEQYGCQGVMLGRAIFGNPWCFSRKKTIDDVPLAGRLRVMVEHAKLFEEKFSGIKNFAIMKKHFKAYVSGFDGAKELRMKLMEAENAAEVAATIDSYLAI